jgi:hypothetical protein
MIYSLGRSSRLLRLMKTSTLQRVILSSVPTSDPILFSDFRTAKEFLWAGAISMDTLGTCVCRVMDLTFSAVSSAQAEMPFGVHGDLKPCKNTIP